ncbi:hypothetical protein COCVIDRAFT_37345 [Bipolaris victoriae FI3]|uniref:Amino acid permease/ SLC12A domain-containing protein n=1 Tax=Bipolaris victoriae (strain FI3) TaxID=930091 RepID=W7EB25_BIPV3|nr:hypothetical protein COCVIDRAFT_37345 [Bipolaris victoriae FI3]
MLAMSFCILGTYATFAQGLSSGLTNGGPVAILWGLVLVFVCNICVGFSLGELCSSMPTALGQAYWVHRLLEKNKAGRFLSYMTAWINTFGWWTLTASQVAFMTEFLLGMKVMFDPEWDGAGKAWVNFMVYLGVTLLFTVVNVAACRSNRFLAIFNDGVGVWFVGLFFAIMLALLISVGVKDGMEYQSPKFVFGDWENKTGWGDGVVWFLGLLQAAYGLTAFDSTIHMIEELPSPRSNGPKVIWLAIVCGAASGFVFMVVCLFCVQDLDLVIDGPTGLPFIELVHQTVGLKGGATLMVLFIVNGLGQGVSLATTGGRLTWGFARDGGLPFSSYFSQIDSYWMGPVRAQWLQGVIIGLVGVLYFFASTVLTAILSVSTIALTISYGIPIACLLVAGRDKLPVGGTFNLGRLGALLNWISVIYCAITTVFFFFPGMPDPSISDMNWAIAVFGVMLVISVVFWLVTGKGEYLQTHEAELRLELAGRLLAVEHTDLET